MVHPYNAVSCNFDQNYVVLPSVHPGAAFRLMRGRGTDGGLSALGAPSSCMTKPEWTTSEALQVSDSSTVLP